jgi:HK97 family phage major capsid protein
LTSASAACTVADVPLTLPAPRSFQLQAAAASWSPNTPVSTLSFPFPAPQGFRRTLIDLLRVIPSGPIAAVPTLTPGAAAVPHARGVAKTASGLAFGGNNETLKSIATYIELTDELADDAVGLQAWLDAFLEYLVKAGEEKEVLTGTRGFLTRTDIPAYAGSATDIVEILGAMHGQVVAASGIEPDTYVVSPAAWGTILTKALADADESTFNGCDVIRSPALTASQALVGAVQSASVLLRNGGIVVERTDSHDVNFPKDITTIRAASMMALGVLAPTAFVKKAT